MFFVSSIVGFDRLLVDRWMCLFARVCCFCVLVRWCCVFAHSCCLFAFLSLLDCLCVCVFVCLFVCLFVLFVCLFD